MEHPKKQHTKSVHNIGRYLMGTKDKGLIFRPTKDSFQVYVDADFAGTWGEADPSAERNTAQS